MAALVDLADHWFGALCLHTVTLLNVDIGVFDLGPIGTRKLHFLLGCADFMATGAGTLQGFGLIRVPK